MFFTIPQLQHRPFILLDIIQAAMAGATLSTVYTLDSHRLHRAAGRVVVMESLVSTVPHKSTQRVITGSTAFSSFPASHVTV